MLHRLLAAALLIGATASLSAQSSESFELYADSYAIPNPNAVVAGDFNNDGKPDFIQCCNSTGLVFRAGNGDGSFGSPVTAASAPKGAAQLVAADVNGDGKLDIVGLPAYGNYPAAPNGTGLAVWMGNGDGTFQAPVVYPTTDSTISVAVGNFFGDGHPDIAVGEIDGNIDLFRNEGNGTFVLEKSIAVSASSPALVQLSAGDLNGTGVSDLAATVYDGFGGSGPLYVLWNNGKGDFTQQELDSSYVQPAVSVVRLNGDGMMDILVSYTCNPTPSGADKGPEYEACAGFDVYYGQGDNHLYKRTVVTDEGVYNLGLPFGVDVNGDGYGDIVSGGSTSCYCAFGLFVWQGNADGSFQQSAQSFITNTDSIGSMAAADFARDSMMSFAMNLISNQNASYFINSTDRAACGKYTISPTVTVCQPVDNTYSPSPVRVDANAYDTTPMTAMQEYIDGTLEYNKPVTSFDTTFPVSDGSHSFVAKGWDTSGRSFVADRAVTVFSGSPGPVCPAATDSASICLPAGDTTSSPVQILANGNTGIAVPTAAQLYINGKLTVDNEGTCSSNGYCTGGTSYVNTTQNLSSGTYDLVFKLWDASGKVYQAQKTITVN
jgi:hypothetical protein